MMVKNWVHSFPSPDCYWMSKILYDIHHQPSHIEAYRDNPDEYMASFPLRSELKNAIRDNDIGAMYLQGVNPLLLRAHCLGLRIPESEFLSSLRKLDVADEESNHG